MDNIHVMKWVEDAPSAQKEFRQAVHTILAAIAKEPKLQADMIIKGGILLAIRFNSSRFTKDIDFSTHKLSEEFNKDEITALLNSSLALVVAEFEYELDCKVQSCKLNPATKHASFPTLQLTIGYAYKGTTKHNKLLALQSPSIVAIDYSFNEFTPNIESLVMDDGEQIKAYTLTDVVAEKYRALLQQKERKRNRRQDVYDLYQLITHYGESLAFEKDKIHQSLVDKSKVRGLFPTKESMLDGEIKNRAKEEYQTLANEIEDTLPDFEVAYAEIQAFYERLTWD